MMSQEAAESELFSIVVLAKMIPTLHHPRWYQEVGAIDELAAESAAKSGKLVCIPPLTQFSVMGFTIACAEERWQIQTENGDASQKILRVAKIVFEQLHHTPVSAFGFNFGFHRRLGLDNVGQSLGKIVSQASVGIDDLQVDAAEWKTKSPHHDGVASFSVLPSTVAPDMLHVSCNFHYDVKALVGDETLFKLAPLLNERFDRDRLAAEERASSIIAAIRGRER